MLRTCEVRVFGERHDARERADLFHTSLTRFQRARLILAHARAFSSLFLPTTVSSHLTLALSRSAASDLSRSPDTRGSLRASRRSIVLFSRRIVAIPLGLQPPRRRSVLVPTPQWVRSEKSGDFTCGLRMLNSEMNPIFWEKKRDKLYSCLYAINLNSPSRRAAALRGTFLLVLSKKFRTRCTREMCFIYNYYLLLLNNICTL